MNTQQIPKTIILLKSAHRVQYVVKWAHGVPKIDTPYYTCRHIDLLTYQLIGMLGMLGMLGT